MRVGSAQISTWLKLFGQDRVALTLWLVSFLMFNMVGAGEAEVAWVGIPIRGISRDPQNPASFATIRR